LRPKARSTEIGNRGNGGKPVGHYKNSSRKPIQVGINEY